MALMKGLAATAMSGSVDGIVFSRNRGGTYMRNRAIPVNPNSIYQQAVRSAMAALASRWSSTLTQVQRDAWDLYALNVPMVNRVGDMINVGGIGMYMRTNVPVIQTGGGGGAIIDAAPVIYDLGGYTPPSIAAITAATEQISLSFDNTDAWANEDDSNMLVFTSRPLNPGINFFKGPYRYAGRIDGDAITPPTSPTNITSPWPLDVGQKIFIRAEVIRADGRLSATFRSGGLAT
jgi:hypothetical protein